MSPFSDNAEALVVPEGFRFGTGYAGLKKNPPDVGVVISETPANHACIFTKNSFPAAPIRLSRATALEHETVGGIVVNAGNANAATGKQGFEDAAFMKQVAERHSAVSAPFLVASTGVIGVPFPSLEKLSVAIEEACAAARSGPEALLEVARAIMTTDTVPKAVSKPDSGYVIAGVTKGAGMIAPSMATTLTFIVTDARANNSVLRWALMKAYRATYERISVDAETSTNDCVFLLANGKSGATITGADAPHFASVLTAVMEELSRKLLKDAEGATKLIRVVAAGFPRDDWARTVARSIGDSLLVKTALHGADANWGRVLSAAGKTQIPLEEGRVTISFGPYTLFAGEPQSFSEEEVRAYLEGDEITIFFDAGSGSHSYEYLTCDLSKEYVEINASYRS